MRALAAPGLHASLRIAMREAFKRQLLGDYGLSEVPGHAAHALDEPDEKIYTTEGRPYDGTEIRIVDEAEQPLPAGQVGAVVVNGPSRFLGFFRNDALMEESLTGGGGYRTGDLGYLDEDGQFVYVGRSKDIIRRGGVTIVPAEVEPVILRHPAVHEVAIVPLPTTGWASAPAPPSSSSPATAPRRSRSCRSSSTARGWRSTRGRSPSRSSRTSRGRRR